MSKELKIFILLLWPSLLVAKIDFNRQIRPILSEHCFACHGLDDPQGGLRLDFAEFAYKGGKSGFPAIAPGDLEDCLLYTSPSPRDATLSRMPSSA